MNCSKYPNLIRWISNHACGRKVEHDPTQPDALAALNEFDAMLACGDKNEFAELVKLRWRYAQNRATAASLMDEADQSPQTD